MTKTIKPRHILAALIIGFFTGWIYRAIQQENEEWKAHQAFITDPEYISYKENRKRMIETEEWIDRVEENLE